jgi:pimeloyl-ACP methyl ester carboxylesterase
MTRGWSLRWPAAVGVFVLATLALAAIANVKSDLPLETLKQRYAHHPSKFLELGGLSVHYRDEGAGPPLVLIHGTGASLHAWQGWTEVLRRDFRVIRMDLPGFGLTGPEPSGDYSSAAYVRFLDNLAARLGLERFDLAGNSLGGFIAWRYAVVHPERIRKLILVDASGYPLQHPLPLVFRLAQIPVLSSLLARMDPRPLVAHTLRDVYADASKVTPELIDLYTDLALRRGNREAFAARVSTVEPDHTSELRRIAAPTLIMWGSLDSLLPVSDAERFARDIRQSRVVIYDGIGHVPMEEIARRTAADAKAFLLEDRLTGR